MRAHSLCLLLTLPAGMLAVNKEHLEIQRDIAAVSEEVKGLRKALDENMVAVKTLLERTLASADKTNTSVVVLEAKMTERLQAIEKSVASSMANMGAKVDSMADEFRAVREGIADLNAKMGRLQTKVVDVEHKVDQIITRPPPPPPAVDPAATGQAPGPQAAAAPAGPPSGVTADKLYNDARRDLVAAKYDQALDQFQNFLRWFPTTDLACNSQFYVADIHQKKGDLEKALAAYEDVLEKYPPDCNKRGDALYGKAKTLIAGDQRTAARDVYRQMLKDFPRGEWNLKAQAGLKELGFNPTAPAPRAKKK